MIALNVLLTCSKLTNTVERHHLTSGAFIANFKRVQCNVLRSNLCVIIYNFKQTVVCWTASVNHTEHLSEFWFLA